MGYPITAIGTLMDEPVTGVCYLEGGLSGKQEDAVNSDFASLRGKRIGYVGHFGKIQIDELFQWHKLLKDDGTPDYQPVRCGMQIADSILNGSIDAGKSLLLLVSIVTDLSDCRYRTRERSNCRTRRMVQVEWSSSRRRQNASYRRAVRSHFVYRFQASN